MEEFVFSLSKVVKYTATGKGEFLESATISINKPNRAVFDESTEFDQMVMKAMISAGEKTKSVTKGIEAKANPEAKENPTASDIRGMLFISDLKMRDLSKVFDKLVLKTGEIAEGVKLKQTHLENIVLEDYIDLICGYAAFFSYPSLNRGEPTK